MSSKLCKSEDLNEKEHENSIGDHRLARSKEQEVKKKPGRISRRKNVPKKKKSAYNEQKKQIIDKHLSEFTERDKNKRCAKKPINGIKRERHPDEILIPRAENGYFSSRSSLWDAEETEDHFPTIPHDLIPIRPVRPSRASRSISPMPPMPPVPPVPPVPPEPPERPKPPKHWALPVPICGRSRSRLFDAEEAEDHYPTFPHVQVLSPYIHSPASPPPDHLDDFNAGSQQQQQIYNPPPVIENNIPHSPVLSALIPPSVPLPQDLLDDLNPNNQQQQHNYFTDIANDVFDEDLPPNPNPAPPPPDYLE